MRTRASALLVNYAGYPSQPNSLMPDNGLASLAKQLKFAGHKVKILDYATVDTMRRLTPPFFQKRLEKVLARAKDGKKVRAFAELKVLAKVLGFHRLMEERRIAREIGGVVRENEVDLLGFKLWSGDGYSGPVRMAGLLKKRFPNLLVVAGGPQVKFFEDRIFSLTGNFDVLAVGDGEATILPLAEVVLGRDLGEVPNIYYRKDGIPTFTRKEQISDMDSLPFPIYDEEIYPAMAGDQKIKILVIEDRRGCDNLCSFCVHPFISGVQPRTKSAERIVDEFVDAIEKNGISNVRLGGSSSPGDYLLKIAELIEQRNIKINFTAFARVRDSQPETFEYLKKNGLFSLFFGVESGNQKVLDGMNKNVSVEKIVEVLKAAKEAGIFTVGSVIYPAPFDTPESRKDTSDLLLKLRPDTVPLQFMGIYPGTKYAEDPEKYNFEIVYPSMLSRFLAGIGLKKKAEYYDREVIKYLINYKIQLLFPPKYWAPLPWKINGMSHNQFAGETQSLYEELEANDILTMLTDEEAMMAKLAGVAPRQFASDTFNFGFTGNWEGMADLVKRINRGSF